MCNIDLCFSFIHPVTHEVDEHDSLESMPPGQSVLTHEGCRKNRRSIKPNKIHDKYISVNCFSKAHLCNWDARLPESIQQLFYEYVQIMIHLVVKITTFNVSIHRPDDSSYPGADYRGKACKMSGSGYVLRVCPPNCQCTVCKGAPTLCFCNVDKVSGSHRYWTIRIKTNHHVLYDDTEAKHSCMTFNDDTEGDTKDVRTVVGGQLAIKDTKWDISLVRYHTHDAELGHRLMELLEQRDDMLTTMTQLTMDMGARDEYKDIMDKFIGVLQGTRGDINGDSGVTVGDSGVTVGDSGVTVGDSGVTVSDSGVTIGDSGVTVTDCMIYVLDYMTDKVNTYLDDSCTVKVTYEFVDIMNKFIDVFKAAGGATNDGSRVANDGSGVANDGSGVTDDMRYFLDYMKDKVTTYLDDNLSSDATDMVHGPVVIISHPHGRTKQVSVGVLENDPSHGDFHNTHPATYKAATCPGSSGGFVCWFWKRLRYNRRTLRRLQMRVDTVIMTKVHSSAESCDIGRSVTGAFGNY